MAQLTRRFLRALGVEEDKIDEIVNAHQDTLEEIKAERDGLKDSASKLAEAQAEMTRLTGELETAKKNSGDAAKVQADFDAYKQQVEADKANNVKTSAARKTLKSAGVQSDELCDFLLSKIDLDTVEVDGDAIKEADKIVAPLKTSYASFFATSQDQGTPPVNPPSGGGGGTLSRAALLSKQYRENLYGAAPTKE